MKIRKPTKEEAELLAKKMQQRIEEMKDNKNKKVGEDKKFAERLSELFDKKNQKTKRQ